MEKKYLRRIKYAIFGFAVGCTSAALGIGGGVLFVPVMVLFLGFDIKKAVGTSLAALVPIAVAGTVAHWLIDPSHIDMIQGLLALSGTLAGVALGLFLHRFIHARILQRLFALLLLFTGLKLSGLFEPLSSAAPSVSLSLYYMPLLGLAAGMCSSFFGIGGGVLLVPGFLFLFGMHMRHAVATSLFVIAPTAFMGAFLHMRKKNVDLNFARSIVPFALIGAVVGALTANIAPGSALKLVLALFLTASAAKMFFRRTETSPAENQGGGI